MRTRWLLILTLALCTFLRFYDLDGYGLWSDEFVTLLIVSSQSSKDVIQTCFEVPQPMPPLYFLANKWIYDFFGPGEVGLRVLSATGSVAAGYFLFAVGRTLFSTEIGLWSLLLFAVNSTQIVYAQNARPYAIGLLLSTASMLCYLKYRRQPSRAWALGYLVATALLLHTHYIFFPVLLIQNIHMAFWRDESAPVSQKVLQWSSWLALQAGVAVLLLPLYPQLWRIVHARQSLNWESKYPGASDFFMFLHPFLLLWGVCAWCLLWFACKSLRSGRLRAREVHPNRLLMQRSSFALVTLWYLLPLALFFVMAQGNGLNLFVERYLVLASMPVFLALPALALAVGPRWAGRGALLVYLLAYVYTTPATYFVQKGHFSQGVPGGNEWREALGQLAEQKYRSSLFLFQSPFIESNQLDFADNPRLARYLAAPLHSFYVRDTVGPFVLLPVYWSLTSQAHAQFRSEIRSRLLAHQDFMLVATKKFWADFEPWLKSEASRGGEWRILESFHSTGALRLKRLVWTSERQRSS